MTHEAVRQLKELDSLGLDPYAFRVYAHMKTHCRHERGAPLPVASTAEWCGMSMSRYRSAVRTLLSRGLVTAHESPGEATRYTLGAHS